MSKKLASTAEAASKKVKPLSTEEVQKLPELVAALEPGVSAKKVETRLRLAEALLDRITVTDFALIRGQLEAKLRLYEILEGLQGNSRNKPATSERNLGARLGALDEAQEPQVDERALAADED